VLWMRRILRMRKPGTKVKKMKPTICLKTGISKPKVASPTRTRVANKITADKFRHFLISQSVGNVT